MLIYAGEERERAGCCLYLCNVRHREDETKLFSELHRDMKHTGNTSSSNSI